MTGVQTCALPISRNSETVGIVGLVLFNCFRGPVLAVFQEAANVADRGRCTVRHDPPTGVFQALPAVAFPQLCQASAGFVALLRGRPGGQEVLRHLLCQGSNRHGPTAEILGIVCQILLVRQLYQRLALNCLQAVVAGDAAAVVKHLHRNLCHADIYFFANQVVWNRVLVPAVGYQIIVGDLGNGPDGGFKGHGGQRQHSQIVVSIPSGNPVRLTDFISKNVAHTPNRFSEIFAGRGEGRW